MFKSNFFNYRFIKIGSQSPTQHLYDLGKSNSTALSKGGVCVGAFLFKDGVMVDQKQDGTDSDQIIWSISRCSDKENYWRMKARQITKGKALKGEDVLISKNYEYDIVKKIANHLANIVNLSFHNKHNKFWENIKNSFNIDSWVENQFQSKNVIIQVDPLMGRSSNPLG